jgi:hypothetical protein
MAQTLTHKDLRTTDADAAQKLVDYYEDNQLNYLIADLNKYRDAWKDRKFIPRVRNITKSIVDKSGLLFNQPPSLEIVTKNASTPVTDPSFNELMERSDWTEFFQNVDVYTRALKTTVVLQQKYVATTSTTQDGKYVPNFQQGDALLLTLLTRANCAFKMDVTNTIINELAFLTSDVTNTNEFTYRCITPDEINDWQVKDDEETLIDSKANPDGFVPANAFYDVLKPRAGCWANVPEDIISLQEMVNIALTDTEFAIAHQKQKTLFTNARVEGSTGKGQNQTLLGVPHAEEGVTPAGTSYPSNMVNTSNANMGGLGKVVTVSTGDPQVEPFVKFDGPNTDLDKLTEVMESLLTGVAYDWSVSLRTDGTGRANSGFQIIVEEMDNLQLRDKRAHSMQAGMRRFYDICQRLYPTLTEGMLRVKFAPPALPVNTVEQEQLWSDKIAAGRASVLDYLRQVEGLDDDAAWEKLEEIQDVNKKLGYSVSLTAKEQATSPAQPAAAGGASSNSNAGSNPTGNP